MSARKHLFSSKKIRSRLTVLAAWLRTHQRLVGLWMFLVGFLLVTFPTIFRILTQQSGKLTNPVALLAPLTARTIRSDEPIRIDKGLLGSAEPSQPPLRILIPKHNVDLSIVEARVINGYWELSETTASHGIGSVNPGERGNSVVFAHARDELFGPLRNIKKDEDIYILTKDRWHRYRVEEIKLVDPNQIEVIAPTNYETLTLFTCSGFLDTKRLIVTAKPLRP